MVGLGTAAFVLFYEWVVDPAPPGSWPVRLFEYLANGRCIAGLDWAGLYSLSAGQ